MEKKFEVNVGWATLECCHSEDFYREYLFRAMEDGLIILFEAHRRDCFLCKEAIMKLKAEKWLRM